MRFFGILRILLFLSAQSLADPTATNIILAGEQKLRGQTTQALIHMTIIRPDFTRNLTVRSWAVNRRNTLVEILSPQKEEGVMSLKTGNKMWNYLPKTDQVVRVPTSLMLQSWMGSDFTNDDLMKASSLARDYTHKILKKVRLGNQSLILIECLPKTGAAVVWAKIHYWAREADSLPYKEEYFEERKKLARIVIFDRFQKWDDRIVPSRIQVKDLLNPGHSTNVTYQKLFYDRKIPPNLFNQANLRKNSILGKSLARSWGLVPLYPVVPHRKMPTLFANNRSFEQ